MTIDIGELVNAAFDGIERRALYPVPEVKQILGGIGQTTLYELMKTDLERVHIGRRTFITAESLAAYINRLREGATA
jgi:hypothetical protein